MLQPLRETAETLGRTPVYKEVPDAWRIKAHFRTWNLTIQAAGLPALTSAEQVQGRALPAGAEPDCTDASAIAAYARDSVAALGKIGAITGRSTGAFSPKDSATRAECAKILYKSLLYLEEN